MALDKSFGVIPLSLEEKKVLLVKHQAGHWALPKGHSNPYESFLETASRELSEETGLKVSSWVNLPPQTENYSFLRNDERIEKEVCYFPAYVTGTLSLQELEIQDAKWVSFQDAITLATFPEMKETLRRFFESYT